MLLNDLLNLYSVVLTTAQIDCFENDDVLLKRHVMSCYKNLCESVKLFETSAFQLTTFSVQTSRTLSDVLPFSVFESSSDAVVSLHRAIISRHSNERISTYSTVDG